MLVIFKGDGRAKQAEIFFFDLFSGVNSDDRKEKSIPSASKL